MPPFQRSSAPVAQPSDRPAAAAEPPAGPEPSPRPLVPAAAFLFLALAIAVTGSFFFKRLEKTALEAAYGQVEAVGRLKSRHVGEWLRERKRDVSIFTGNAFFIERVDRWIRDGNPEDGRRIRYWLSALRNGYRYKGIYLIDSAGEVRMTVGPPADFAPPERDLVARAIASGTTTFSEFHWEGTGRRQHPEIDMATPLLLEAAPGGKPSALIYLSMDPAQELYPVIQENPAPSRSAETLLVRRDGDDVLYLNELRHKEGTALTLRLPVSRRDLPAAQALRGKEGIVRGRDYRGVPCIAFLTRIPETPWLLVSKIDEEEVLTPLRRQQRWVTAIAALLITVAGGGAFLWWRQQRAKFLAAHYKAELERRSLAVRCDDLFRNASDSRDKFAALFSACPAPIIATTLDGVVTEWNDAATAVFGWSESEAAGGSLPFVPEESRRDSLDILRQVADGRTLQRVELVRRTKGGAAIDVSLSLGPLRSADGSIYGAISVIEEITERKRAERVMKENETRYRLLSEQFHALLNALPDSIFLLNRENRVLWSNAAAAEELGCTPEAVEGEFCFTIRHGRPVPCTSCPTLKAFSSGKHEYSSVTTPAGKALEIRAIPILDAGGETERVIEIVRDVTERVRFEEHLRHAQKMDAIGTLAGGIAHDFNNILSVVMGYAALLDAKMPAGDPLRKNVANILTASERAATLTKGLLAYSRKTPSAEMQPTELNRIVARSDLFLSRTIGEHIRLTAATSASPLPVLADEAQIEQVLMNLAINARDAMPAGGELTIRTEETVIDAAFVAAHGFGREGRFALLSVSDTGTGIPREVMGRIFEPFFTTKEIGKGTGLGLSIVFGIVKHHGGFVNVYSEPGNGTTFRVYLPLLQEEMATAAAQADDEKPPGGDETVLVIEDNDQIRGFLAEVLAGEGYTVLEAADGEEGVRKFAERSGPIDLLLLDVVMPRKNGRETFDEIRAIDRSVRAIFMSGYTDDVITRQGIDAEGVRFVAKPVRPAAVLREVRSSLDGDRRPENGEG